MSPKKVCIILDPLTPNLFQNQAEYLAKKMPSLSLKIQRKWPSSDPRSICKNRQMGMTVDPFAAPTSWQLPQITYWPTYPSKKSVIGLSQTLLTRSQTKLVDMRILLSSDNRRYTGPKNATNGFSSGNAILASVQSQMKLTNDLVLFEEKHLILFANDCLKSRSVRCQYNKSPLIWQQFIVENLAYRDFNTFNLILCPLILSSAHWILFVFDRRFGKSYILNPDEQVDKTLLEDLASGSTKISIMSAASPPPIVLEPEPCHRILESIGDRSSVVIWWR